MISLEAAVRGRLLWHIMDTGLPDPRTEYPFRGLSGTRRYRFDLAWPEERIAVEIDGAIWRQGRHTRGAGYINDRVKDCEATVTGWRVLRVTAEMIDNGDVIAYLERLLTSNPP